MSKLNKAAWSQERGSEEKRGEEEHGVEKNGRRRTKKRKSKSKGELGRHTRTPNFSRGENFFAFFLISDRNVEKRVAIEQTS